MTSNELLSVKQQFGIIGNTEALNTAIEIAMRVAPTDLTSTAGTGYIIVPGRQFSLVVLITIAKIKPKLLLFPQKNSRNIPKNIATNQIPNNQPTIFT